MYNNPYLVYSIPQGSQPDNLYPHQEISETDSRVRPDRDVEFPPDLASEASHGPGFKRYSWKFMMNPNEYLVCRLGARENEKVMSGGFATNPLAPVYAVENFPLHPNVWVISLRNTSAERLELFLYLIARS